MSTIRVSDLNSENDSDSLELLNSQEHDLVKDAVARAIDARKVVGGSSIVKISIGYTSPAEFEQSSSMSI